MKISHRKDKLIHFLRKQVHTESNNTLIGLTKQIFNFWYNGNLESIVHMLPKNVYESIDKKSEYYAPIHDMVVEMCSINNNYPDELLAIDESEFENLLSSLKHKQ